MCNYISLFVLKHFFINDYGKCPFSHLSSRPSKCLCTSLVASTYIMWHPPPSKLDKPIPAVDPCDLLSNSIQQHVTQKHSRVSVRGKAINASTWWQCESASVYAFPRVRESAWEFLVSPFRGVASWRREASWKGRACASLLTPRRLFALLIPSESPPPLHITQRDDTQITHFGSKHANTAAWYPPICLSLHPYSTSVYHLHVFFIWVHPFFLILAP